MRDCDNSGTDCFSVNVASISSLFNIFLQCAPRPSEFCPRVLPGLCKICPKISKSAPTFQKLPRFLPLPRSACPDEILSNPATFCRLAWGYTNFGITEAKFPIQQQPQLVGYVMFFNMLIQYLMLVCTAQSRLGQVRLGICQVSIFTLFAAK